MLQKKMDWISTEIISLFYMRDWNLVITCKSSQKTHLVVNLNSLISYCGTQQTFLTKSHHQCFTKHQKKTFAKQYSGARQNIPCDGLAMPQKKKLQYQKPSSFEYTICFSTPEIIGHPQKLHSFSAVLSFLPVIFSIRISETSSIKNSKAWTEPTRSKMNHTITNFDLM